MKSWNSDGTIRSFNPRALTSPDGSFSLFKTHGYVSIHGLLRALTDNNPIFRSIICFNPRAGKDRHLQSRCFNPRALTSPDRVHREAREVVLSFNPRALTSPDSSRLKASSRSTVSIHGLLRALTRTENGGLRRRQVSIHGLLRALTWIENGKRVFADVSIHGLLRALTNQSPQCLCSCNKFQSTGSYEP